MENLKHNACANCHWNEQCGDTTRCCGDYTPLNNDTYDELYYLHTIKERTDYYNELVAEMGSDA